MENKKAMWYKVIGGDFGAIKISGKWKSYRCLYCIRNQYPNLIGQNRWQGSPSSAIQKSMKNFYFDCIKNH